MQRFVFYSAAGLLVVLALICPIYSFTRILIGPRSNARFFDDMDVTQGGIGQYHGCWWPGEARSQGISNHTIGQNNVKRQILRHLENGVMPMLEIYATVLCLPTYIIKQIDFKSGLQGIYCIYVILRNSNHSIATLNINSSWHIQQKVRDRLQFARVYPWKMYVCVSCLDVHSVV